MSQIVVVPVERLRPGKAQVYLRPEANALLEKAIELYGKPIYPTGSGSAGRTYAQQEHYWNVFQNGGPVASRPDRGPRPHMRFGAIDIDDERARSAMLRAGWLATTPSEWWHFEHPQTRSWPIVTDPIYEEDDMSFTDNDRALLQQIRDQIGGASSRETSLRQDVDRLAGQIGGSSSRTTSLREDVDRLPAAVAARISQIPEGADDSVVVAKLDEILALLGDVREDVNRKRELI